MQDITKLREKARHFREKRKYKKAAELYAKMATLDPSNPRWPHRLGETQQRLGKDDEAMEAFIQGADAYAAKGFILKAIALCKMILALDPNHQQTQQTLAELYSTSAAQRLGGQVPASSSMMPKMPDQPSKSVMYDDSIPLDDGSIPLDDGSIPLDDGSIPLDDGPPPVRPPAPEKPITLVDSEMTGAEAATLLEPLPLNPEPARTPAPPSPRPAADTSGLEFEYTDGAPNDDVPMQSTWDSLNQQAPAMEPPKPPAKPPMPTVNPRLRRGETLDSIELTAVVQEARPLSAPDEEQSLFEIPLPPSPLPEPELPQQPEDSLSPESLLLQLPPVPLLSALDEKSLRLFIETVEATQFAPGDRIIEQGTPGDALFILVEGEVEVYRDGTPKITLGRLKEGAFFGEMALVTDLKRTANVKAITECTLLKVTREVMADLVTLHPPVLKALLGFFRNRLIENLMETHEMFAPFNKQERRELMQRFSFVEARRGCVLVKEGEMADGLYLMVCGEVDVNKGEKVVQELGPGDLFGKTSLLNAEPSANTVRTASKCWLLKLGQDIFRELIMTHPHVLALVSEGRATGRMMINDIGIAWI